jgi:hypothetical protein
MITPGEFSGSFIVTFLNRILFHVIYPLMEGGGLGYYGSGKITGFILPLDLFSFIYPILIKIFVHVYIIILKNNIS